VNEQVAKYKMRPDNEQDSLTIDMLRVLANDYRKKAKLEEVRQQSGIEKVQERLQQLKKKDQDDRKARRNGTYVDKNEPDSLVKKMQQQMLLVHGEVV